MKHIVAAVDGSGPSLKAVSLAADLANKYGAELVLVTIGGELSAALTPEVVAYAREEHIEAPLPDLASAHVENVLAEARLTAEAQGVTRVSTRWSLGDAAAEIIHLADEAGADLIVLGSRGHGRLVGLLLGSVVQNVLAHARCPVLVVR
jgi:nucleotide-binding universal stress UspA family protein